MLARPLTQLDLELVDRYISKNLVLNLFSSNFVLFQCFSDSDKSRMSKIFYSSLIRLLLSSHRKLNVIQKLRYHIKLCRYLTKLNCINKTDASLLQSL